MQPSSGLLDPHRGRQATYRARLRASGLRQVAVWVPADKADPIRAEAARLRSEAGLGLPVLPDCAQLTLFPADNYQGAFA